MCIWHSSPSVAQQKPIETRESPRVDLYGDPLPAGVLARFGCAAGGYAGSEKWARLLFSSDETSLLSIYSWGEATLWKARGGARLRDYQIPDIFLDVCFPPTSEHPWFLFTPTKRDCLMVREGEKDRRLNLDIPANFGIQASAISQDGKWVAIAGSENVVRTWNAETGMQNPLLVHKGKVHSLEFDGSGNRIATVCADQQVRIWELNTGKTLITLPWRPIKTPSGEQRPKTAFSKNGKLFALQKDEKVILWNVEDGQPLWQDKGGLRRVGADITSLNFIYRGDSARLLIADANGVHEFFVEDKTLKNYWRPFSNNRGRTDAMSLAPSGRFFAVWKGGELGIWDTVTEARLTRPGTEWTSVSALALSHDGKLVASGDSYHGKVSIWDIASQKQLRTFTVPITNANDDTGSQPKSRGIRQLEFSPDGKRLLVVLDDTVLHVYDPHAGRLIHRLAAPPCPLNDGGYFELRRDFPSAVFALQGKVIVGARNEDCPVVWDVESGKVLGVLRVKLRQPDRKPDADAPTYRYPLLTYCEITKKLTASVLWNVPYDEGETVESYDSIAFWDLADLSKVLNPTKVKQDGENPSLNLGFSSRAPKETHLHLTFRSAGWFFWGENPRDIILLDQSRTSRGVGNDAELLVAYSCPAVSKDERLFAAVVTKSTVYTQDPPYLQVWEAWTGSKVGIIKVPLAHPDDKVSSMVFAPNGRTITLSLSVSRSIFVFPIPRINKVPQGVEQTQLIDLWKRLSNEDAGVAQHGMEEMTIRGNETTAFLAGRLQPSPRRIPDQQIVEWVNDLGSNIFSKRTAAERGLLALGSEADAFLRTALFEKKSDRELVERATSILKKLPRAHPSLRIPVDRNRLQTLRSIRVLEVAVHSVNLFVGIVSEANLQAT
jgi:WD40 repeat protein